MKHESIDVTCTGCAVARRLPSSLLDRNMPSTFGLGWGRDMDFFIQAGLFTAGFFFGTLVFTGIWLPLIYGLPTSLWLVFKRKLRWTTPLKYLVSPIVWNVVFVLIAWGLLEWAPNVAKSLAESGAFNWASVIAIGFFLLNSIFSKSARADLRADFDKVVQSSRR